MRADRRDTARYLLRRARLQRGEQRGFGPVRVDEGSDVRRYVAQREMLVLLAQLEQSSGRQWRELVDQALARDGDARAVLRELAREAVQLGAVAGARAQLVEQRVALLEDATVPGEVPGRLGIELREDDVELAASALRPTLDQEQIPNPWR